MSISTTETRTVTLSELKKYAMHNFKQKRPMFVWGPPGIGKSETFVQIQQAYIDKGMTCALIDARLALWDPTDLKGYPYFDQTANKMRFSAPDELPDAEMAAQYDVIILFLDELNGASPATQAAAYQLILNRAIGKYQLPDNVVIAAAGNRDTDKGVTYRMPKPLANRFLHYEVRVDFPTWFDWAVRNNIHPDVVGYLQTFKNDLYNFDAGSAERSFATPRSWTFVSETLADVEDFTEEEVTDMVGEITNMVTGGAKNLLGEKGYDFEMATPIVVSGTGHTITHKCDGAKLMMPFTSEDGNAHIEVSFDTL